MDKLQELTDRLYNEGLSKGKEDGAALLAQAQAKSDDIIKAALEIASERSAQILREMMRDS